jgi:hypothetical protein
VGNQTRATVELRKTEPVLVTSGLDHKKYLQPKLIVKIRVEDGFIQFDRQRTHVLHIVMNAHLTLLEHYTQNKKKARAAEARLQTVKRCTG